MRFVLVVAVVVTGVTLAAKPALGGGPTGSFSGAVFEDLNANGVRDPGEPGLPHASVKIEQGGALLGYILVHADGTFSIPNMTPGDYTLTSQGVQNGGECADYAFSFNPTQTSYCINYTLPWRTKADPVTITVAGGSNTTVDFSFQPSDVAVLAGVALLEDQRALGGTLIEALINGNDCGTTMVRSGNVELNYIIQVLGASERPGCAGPGDAVEFRIGGITAGETYSYVRFADYQRLPNSHSALQLQPLSAMLDHAWYWFERRGPGLNQAAIGAAVEARLDGAICAEATLQGGTNRIGFSRLIVESESLHTGCGRSDATVTFRVGGVKALESFPWEPRLRRLELTLYGDANCDLVLDAVDSALLLQYSAALVASLPCQVAADANNDGSIDAIDATLTLQFGAGLLVSFPPE